MAVDHALKQENVIDPMVAQMRRSSCPLIGSAGFAIVLQIKIQYYFYFNVKKTLYIPMNSNKNALTTKTKNKSFTKYHTTQRGTPSKYGKSNRIIGRMPCIRISITICFFV